jgi:ubiquinone/menaquinone biosynthesis C-methylase UbiE
MQRSNLKPLSFSDVDASGLAADHAAYLDHAASRVAEHRKRWIERLGLEPGAVVLDAGSGMGEMTTSLAAAAGPGGRSVGVDLSAELVERARQRTEGVHNVEYRCADLTALPFDDDTFDAAYSERVFMHLHEPDAVMQELHRVLRPGGRLVVVDADFSRSAIDADDGELTDLLAARLEQWIANFRSGRQLRSQAVVAGFVEVEVDVDAMVLTDRDAYEQISGAPYVRRIDELVADAVIDRARGDAFLRDQDTRVAEGRFQVTVVRYLVAATKAAAT